MNQFSFDLPSLGRLIGVMTLSSTVCSLCNGLLPNSFTTPAWAGTDPVQAGDSSSSGTFDFGPDASTPSREGREGEAAVQSALSTFAEALNGSDLGAAAQKAFSTPPASKNQISNTVAAIKKGGDLATTITTNGGSEATVALATGMVAVLGSDASPTVAAAVAQVALSLQGLTTGTTINGAQLAAGVDAFNGLVDALSNDQVISAVKSSELQQLRNALASLVVALSPSP